MINSLVASYAVYIGFQPWETDFDHTKFLQCKRSKLIKQNFFSGKPKTALDVGDRKK